MNLIAQESESHECQDGQVFCKAMEACVQPCFTSYAETCSPNSPVSPVCPSGHVCCQKDASKTCTTPEDCQKSAGLHLPSPTCPDGYVFCLSVGGCVEGSCPDVSVGGRCEGNRVSGVLWYHLIGRHASLITGKNHINQYFSLPASETHRARLWGTCLCIYFY
ncbi:hypothetical protein E2C01_076840 [Portunus trituberculatus]|uniref:Uncharacterized protein n=1 Tax=Portunus trituberculatus TaxID=210409 RepID=A0A5B7IE82_PORTR|nr:hypothetical protein [Portunus trituberculatus]